MEKNSDFVPALELPPRTSPIGEWRGPISEVGICRAVCTAAPPQSGLLDAEGVNGRRPPSFETLTEQHSCSVTAAGIRRRVRVIPAGLRWGGAARSVDAAKARRPSEHNALPVIKPHRWFSNEGHISRTAHGAQLHCIPIYASPHSPTPVTLLGHAPGWGN